MIKLKASKNNNFNFLRLVLALFVILSHSTLLLDGNTDRDPLTRLISTTSFGQFAVECFFLISGYLIVQSWVQSPNTGSYLRKRVLSIYPGFIVASFFCAFVAGPLGAQPRKYFEAFWYSVFAKSLLFLQIPRVPDVFQGQPFPIINGSMWSIRLEFICYITVLGFGILGLFHRKRLWPFLMIPLYLVTLFYRLALLPENISHQFAWAESLLRLSTFFFIGGCFYIYRDIIYYNSIAAISVIAVTLLCVLGFKLDYLLFVAGGAYLLFYLAFMPIKFLRGFDKLPDVSYGAYLYGWPVQKLLLWYFPIKSPWTLFLLSASLSLLLGGASWYAVEKPFTKLKSPQIRKQIFASTSRMEP